MKKYKSVYKESPKMFKIGDKVKINGQGLSFIKGTSQPKEYKKLDEIFRNDIYGIIKKSDGSSHYVKFENGFEKWLSNKVIDRV